MNMQKIVRKNLSINLVILALLGIGHQMTDYPLWLAGMALGLLFGMYNIWILGRKSKQFDRAIDEGRRPPTGTFLRFMSGVAAVALASAFPDQFNLIGTAIGFAVPYFVLFLERLAFHVKHDMTS